MQFSSPAKAYDDLRIEMFGAAKVPWPPGEPGGGTTPEDAATAILARVAAQDDKRLRVLVGDDAPAQVRAALDIRHEVYARDPRFPTS